MLISFPEERVLQKVKHSWHKFCPIFRPRRRPHEPAELDGPQLRHGHPLAGAQRQRRRDHQARREHVQAALRRGLPRPPDRRPAHRGAPQVVEKLRPSYDLTVT